MAQAGLELISPLPPLPHLLLFIQRGQHTGREGLRIWVEERSTLTLAAIGVPRTGWVARDSSDRRRSPFQQKPAFCCSWCRYPQRADCGQRCLKRQKFSHLPSSSSTTLQPRKSLFNGSVPSHSRDVVVLTAFLCEGSETFEHTILRRGPWVLGKAFLQLPASGEGPSHRLSPLCFLSLPAVHI